MTLALLAACGQRGRAFGRSRLPSEFSSLDAPSTELYNPSPHPVWLANAPDMPNEFVDSAKGARDYVSDVLLTDLGGDGTANMAALNDAIADAIALEGDKRIRLPLDALFVGECTLRKQDFETGWIDIEAATAPCAEGTRATEANMTSAPEFRCIGDNQNAIDCGRGADRYRVMGVKCVPEPTASGVIYFTVHIHAQAAGLLDEEAQSLLEHCPRDIILDRILVVGPAGDTGSVPSGAGVGTPWGRNRNGVSLNGIRCALVDSTVVGAYSAQSESHGVITHNAPGPLKFVNNFIDAGSVPLFFGGTPPGLGLPDGQPKDIEIRRNHLAHPEAWCPPDGGGSNKYGLKGLFELKDSSRTLFEGNVLERCPNGAQTGMAIVIKSAGDGAGTSTGMGTNHATLRYNIVRNVRHAFNVDGLGDPIESGVVKCNHVSAYNNLFYDIGIVTANGDQSGNPDSASGKPVILGKGTDYLNIRFNTFVINLRGQATMLGMAYVDTGTESIAFDFSDNVLTSPSSTAPVFYDGGFYGSAAMNLYAATWTFDRNLITGVWSDYAGNIPLGTGNETPFVSSEFPSLATVIADCDFEDADGNDYRLASTSPGYQSAFGGADMGANIALVDLATTGVVP